MSEPKQEKLMRVGELAKAVGKTVRAMHLYEELGLLEPRARSEGGFRMYGAEAVDRIHWIVKLQAIGFTLAEIQGFVKDFQHAQSAPEASARVRALFVEKQAQIREQITQLQVIENDLSEALSYLDSCQTCSTDYAPSECGDCDHQGHHKGEAPPLFAALATSGRCPPAAGDGPSVEGGSVRSGNAPAALPSGSAGLSRRPAAGDDREFDVPVAVLYREEREGNN